MQILTEENTMVREMAAGFLSVNAPVETARALRDHRSALGYDRTLLAETAAMGWYGMLLGEDAGGTDMGAQAAGLIAEEMGRRLTNAPFLSSGVMSASLLRHVGETTLAAEIASGTAVVTLATDETTKHAPDKIETTAAPSGNGFVLNGSKRFVNDAIDATRVIVPAQTDAGLGLFLVDPALEGVTTRAYRTVDNRNAADLTFDNVQLDGAAQIAVGPEAEAGFAAALRVGRAVASAELVGVSKEAAERTVAYLKERKQFGVTLSKFQALQHRSADLYTQIQTAEAITAAALAAIDEGREDAERLSRAAKAKASKTASLAVREAVQMHGGMGMTDALDIGLFMKKARAAIEHLGDAGCHAEWLLRDRGI
ncbi:acyl-CoA dehydrogenase family protein [Pelagimonas sp. KU-00592-HH]|uniref:acyl-CoA dehydrogenase family protein n=1 Tax=Pelagimonas sp. KU-00592-HH TaxID=3127651 RepID=UPI003106835F